jgi:endo-1,4-beta-xylanase
MAFLCSYNLEYGGAKTSAMLALAKQLVADGVPLDGIGFQGHLIVGSTPSATTLAGIFKQFADLNLDVAVEPLLNFYAGTLSYVCARSRNLIFV